MPDHFTGHADLALSRVLTEMRGLPGFAVMVSSLADELQLVEDALWSVYTQCMLAAAAGAQLDAVGAVLNYPRDTPSDSTYRLGLGAQILLLRSSGTPDQVLAILQAFSQAGGFAVVGSLEEYQPMTAIIEVFHLSSILTATLVRFARAAKPVGVRLDLVYSFGTEARTFKFAGGVSEVEQHGFATVLNEDILGGVLASVTTC